MKNGLILDANIFFSLMSPISINSYIFSFLKEEIVAPNFIKAELEEHKSECVFKSKLSEQQFEIRREEIESFIKFVDVKEYKSFLKIALGFTPDEDDVPNIALALSNNYSIWSNDLHFIKQSAVKVFTTREMLFELFGYLI
ncbi:hypothetical protein HYW75_06025 [Candidatus Pacearchaeota archaeon]|nr:hypothetical protein [Candidatus Pacearchaeota archaeon]